jgi:hypothetical protein
MIGSALAPAGKGRDGRPLFSSGVPAAIHARDGRRGRPSKETRVSGQTVGVLQEVSVLGEIA